MDVRLLGLAGGGQVLRDALVDLVTLFFVREHDQQSGLFGLSRHAIGLDELELEADLEQLEPALEELREVRDLVVQHRLVVDVVVRLKVDPRIRYEETPDPLRKGALKIGLERL